MTKGQVIGNGIGASTQESSKSWADAIRGNLIAITGVLVAFPALINAGVDVYRVATNSPRTDAERTNIALYKKYFNKSPVVVMPVPIKVSAGNVEARFSVYEGGDVFVEFGENTGWFPLPIDSAEKKHIAFSLISSAFAQGVTGSPANGAVISQSDRELGNNRILRSRLLSNGKTEQLVIDMRTGDIKSRSLIQTELGQKRESLSTTKTINGKTIDLTAGSGG